MNKSPLISVIVPAYNAKDYLRECLDSICNQSYKNLEIICINDGSTDNSEEIMRDYAKKDSRIKILSQHNQGLSASRNNGIKEAHGEYITFIDSDDYVSHDMIEELYKRAQQTQAQVVISNFSRIYSSPAREEVATYWKRLNQKKVEPIDSLPEKFRYQDIVECAFVSPCFVWGKLYSHKFIKENALKFEVGMYYEDGVFFIEILKCNPLFSYIDKPLYKYRISENSISHSVNKHQLDLLKSCSLIEERVRRYKLNKKLLKNLYFTKTYNLPLYYNAIPEEYKSEYTKLVKKHLRRKDYNKFLETTQNIKIKDFFLFKIIKKNKKA